MKCTVMRWGILLSILSALVLLISCVATSTSPSNPQSAKVVLPQEATAIERFAAEELCRCLRLATGMEILIASASAVTEVTFWIGTAETLSRLEALPVGRINEKLQFLNEDGVYLWGDGKDIILTGKGKRGAINAVYMFLEQCVGFHWPEPSQEFVPQAPQIKLKDLDLVSNPAFTYRGIAIHGRCNAQWFAQILDWLSKNRMNSFQVFPAHYEQLRPMVLNEVLKRGLYPNIGGHSREFFFPASKYFQLHPDWFALVQGKRISDGQICYSELSSVTEYASNVIDYLKSRPEIGMASLWPSDGNGFCECDKCKSRQTTDVLLNYINQVTAKVIKAVPDAKTEFLSYIHYVDPPKEEKPLPQLVPTYCEYLSRSQFHPITDNRSGNAKCREQLAGWIATSNQVTVFSYYGDDYIKRFIYNPLIDVIKADLQYYRSINLAGNFVLLTNPESWWSQAPHLYAYTRFAWDPDVSLKQVEQDYYLSLYGAAAPAMKAHAKATRELFELKLAQGVTGEDLLWGLSWGDLAKINETQRQGNEVVDELRTFLVQARSVNSESYVRERLDKLIAEVDYLAFLFDFAAAAQSVYVEKTTETKQQLMDLAIKGLELEIIANDDFLSGRAARNVLLNSTHYLTGQMPPIKHGTPAQIKEFEQDGIWRWATADVVPSSKVKPRQIVVEVTNKVKASGVYEVIWQYLDGADALAVLSTGIYTATVAGPKAEDLIQLTIDEHAGLTGAVNIRNVYSLRLDQYDPSARYFVVARIYDEREFDTFGHVLLRME